MKNVCRRKITPNTIENGDYNLRDDAPIFDEVANFEFLPLDEIRNMVNELVFCCIIY